MEKLFTSLRTFLDTKEKALSEMSTEDAVLGLGDMTQEFGDIVGAFIQAAQDILLDPDGDGDLGDIDVDAEPDYFPNLDKLARAAVQTLLIRGDMVAQLKEAGFDDLAQEVADYAVQAVPSAKRDVNVG